MGPVRARSSRFAAPVADGFRDERGFTTLGTVLALLISLSLLFSAAQVQRINSVAAEVQDVADAAALAAQNEVAEFMVIVRVCDAAVLTMTLTGLIVTGVGVVALCIPPTSGVGAKLVEVGTKIIQARDRFSDAASKGLDKMQAALPFLSAANAASIAQANNGSDEGSSYLALALPCPATGEPLAIEADNGEQDFAGTAQQQAGDIKSAGEYAEEMARRANESKQLAFAHDCGNDPGYCMYERAATLAGMTGADNPLYRSVDSWSFSVALERARDYYDARIANERPEGDSVEDQARS